MLRLVKFHQKLLLLFLLSINLHAFYVGVGGFNVCIKNNKSTYYKNCSFEKQIGLVEVLKKELPNVNAISMWITRDWQEEWYPANKVNEIIKKGYTPIFIFYWFADDISPSYVRKKQRKYYESLNRFINYLQQIKGEKIVILNPEYNETGMSDSIFFDLLQTQSIKMIKDSVKNVKVGICLGDFGDYEKANDIQNWEMDRLSLTFSSKASDFIAFQEMRAITRNTPKEILTTPKRILQYSKYLYNTYKKPTFLAYIAISSYKANDLQTKVFKDLLKYIPEYKKAKMIGINLFNYIDVPEHEGYFLEAEKHFGIKKANGEEKKSFYYFKQIK